jgi:hypothetical protein
MSLCRRFALAIAALWLHAGVAAADGDGFILGFGGETDTASGRAATVFGDLGLTRHTWLSSLLAKTTTSGALGSLDTLYADVGVDHWFEPLGIRLGGGYWGDDRILDSNDLRGSVYFKNDAISISADYERRDFEFTINNILLPAPRTIGFYADGYGINARFDASDTVAITLGGMYYGYSRNINLQPNVDLLRIFTTSRLGLMNSLLDYRVSAGIGWTLGLQDVDFRIERWQTSIDQENVDSIGIGVTTPAGQSSDMEFRVSYDRSRNFGDTLALSVYYYFFGD